MAYESWIDRQVREAIERGAFDDLPGAGKPLSLNDDPDWWVKSKIAAENLEPLLPTSLALRREVQRLPETLANVRVEQEARAIVEDLNARIKDSYLRPQDGPRVVVGLVDVAEAISQWRQR
ncbi:MAG: DUF1992 domain-containing protein [Actinobacteria bacterium HGW-Actinobacteria-2]|nr:MAG: DUF1992 domain-containing protein [Actinobacteria bacterium HGW-Actinobacteria-2]